MDPIEIQMRIECNESDTGIKFNCFVTGVSRCDKSSYVGSECTCQGCDWP